MTHTAFWAYALPCSLVFFPLPENVREKRCSLHNPTFSLLPENGRGKASHSPNPAFSSLPLEGDGPGVRAKTRFTQFPNGLANLNPCNNFSMLSLVFRYVRRLYLIRRLIFSRIYRCSSASNTDRPSSYRL